MKFILVISFCFCFTDEHYIFSVQVHQLRQKFYLESQIANCPHYCYSLFFLKVFIAVSDFEILRLKIPFYQYWNSRVSVN